MTKKFMSIDGNTVAAHCVYTFTELSAVYPITPFSLMAEVADQWATQGHKNIFDSVVEAAEPQSEGGVVGTVHSALQAGSLATTFAVSQGLPLMTPDIYGMVSECLPGAIHVAARTLATRALNIFGDYEDIYAYHQSGICMLVSHSVQEAMGLTGVTHLIAIKGSVPFMHFFDRFCTPHEIQKTEVTDTDVFKELIDKEALAKFRKNALNSHINPVIRGDAGNDGTFLQGVKARNKHFDAIPGIVTGYTKKISGITGRKYVPFIYYGASDVERVIVAMGSVAETVKKAIDALAAAGGEVGMIKAHLYRPFSVEYLLAVLPEVVKKIAVLNRTKEAGSMGGPLYPGTLSVLKNKDIEIISGHYDMGSKDAQSYHIKAVFDELKKDEMENSFTISIVSDVISLSPEVDSSFHASTGYTSCSFWGLGSNGTVSTNKSTVKVVGDNTDRYAQTYSAYDFKKIGGVTRSHLRFGSSPIRSAYYTGNADLISCSLGAYMLKHDMAGDTKEGGSLLLSTIFSKEEIAEHMPNRVKTQLAKEYAKFYTINATKVAQETGMGRRISTILQFALFALNEQIMPYGTAVKLIKTTAKKSYSKKDDAVVQLNYKAVGADKVGIGEITVDAAWADLPFDSSRKLTSDEYFDSHVVVVNGLEDCDMPVGVSTGDFLLDSSICNSIVFREKRIIAIQIPAWYPENRIQCGICSFVCPYATIHPFPLIEEEVAIAPMELETITSVGKGVENLKYRIQVTPANYVDCGLCAAECLGKAGNKAPEMVDTNEKFGEEPLADYLFKHTEYKTESLPTDTVRGSQSMMPHFEVSGARSGCGKTPYYKLVSQLFGHDILVANATGCSMICCSSAPSTPFVDDNNGEGVVWVNFLFEDNTGFGYGTAPTQDCKESRILKTMGDNMENVEPALKEAFAKYLEVHGDHDAEREIVPTIKELVAKSDITMVKKLADVDLVSRPTWIVGGDGWTYDIGYGGLGHVLANNLNVDVLVPDTEVYSSTGGQSSKPSQAASIAKFVTGGKTTAKKDLGQIAMAYEYVYVAVISMGTNKNQVLKALKEVENYDGPSLTLAYSPCAEHGIRDGLANYQRTQAEAAEYGYLDLYCYDPREETPLIIDPEESDYGKMLDFMIAEARYSQLSKVKGEITYEVFEKTKKDAMKRRRRLFAIAKEEM